MSILKWLRKTVIYKILKLKTFGVRIAIFDKDKILLVRHYYDNLWVFPGGLINKNDLKKENGPLEAALREAKEEVSLKLLPPVIEFSKYQNNAKGKNDTVFLFVSHDWQKDYIKKRLIDKIEIRKVEWFNIYNLPQNISKSTKKRIEEILDSQKEISKNW